MARLHRLVAAVVLGAGLTGCTMCPDPFDYTGPVPNGSAPQNDFRARSNGILPLNAAPRPWPPLVKASAGDRRGGLAANGDGGLERTTFEEPTLAEPIGEDPADGETPFTVGEPSSVLVMTSGDDAGDDAGDDGACGPEPAPLPSTDEPAAAGSEPMSAAEVPALPETPGWRPKF